ncbi:thiamine diphosphokinase [Rickettsiales endosymbiont of Peranema trichophorum]|uniref:thiamine diphosphokinase n=1 Tax=Rickettsiales endosymbiont of Peranema trichophorum TaxID=2486577 RepID=UPI001023E3FC|nr:thiamine diphosphokinase [Rickettsiales endosymbiont of Peranema trichophorum]RZI47472.1 thiamine diphosphokinase [Rickettsiales endosymbiont of Peranema trichophorum]
MTKECHDAFCRYIDIHQYRSVLALQGELPDSEFFKATNLPIVASDGAANTLFEMGIKPYVVVGDLDSAKSEYLMDVKITHIPDQNHSDFEKAIAYATEYDLLPTIVVGVAGGCIDHVTNNIGIFVSHCTVFYSPPTFGYVVQPTQTKDFDAPTNTKISIFGIPDAIVSTNGLKWELSQTHLKFPTISSLSNRTALKNFQIKVHTGKALAIVYLI